MPASCRAPAGAVDRAATAYAVYASQIAVQIAADRPVTDTGSSVLRLKPSDVITAAGMAIHAIGA